MRDVDPSTKVITSTSGTCVPSHDREQLDCYFTSFGIWRVRTDEQLKKDEEELQQAFKNDAAKQVKDMRESFCSKQAAWMQPDTRQQLNPRAASLFGSVNAFCRNPTRDAAIVLSRALAAVDAKKCRCVVVDWRSLFVRQLDRWVENAGPSGVCGVVTVSTLIPHSMEKIKTRTGPTLWTLHEKTVTTHKPDDPLCANPTKNPLLPSVKDGAMTVSWDAPSKPVECDGFEFTSALDGMSNPRDPKGK